MTGFGIGQQHLYRYGANSTINAVYDEVEASNYTPQALDKHISSGKQRIYNLKLSACEPVTSDEDVQMTSQYYRQVQPGHKVTVAMLPGRRGVP